jgi:protein-L-isoaspartate(D-aspartate) O-methyltransferase
MIDFATQRFNMVESQVRPNGVTDARVIAAMAAVPREEFVPAAARGIAYMDEDIAIGTSRGDRRYLMEPMAFALLLQHAAIGPADVVLDVGVGTGYSVAVLSHLAQSVIGIEADRELAARASEILTKLDIGNAVIIEQTHDAGYRAEAPYSVIIVEGRVPAAPAALLSQLDEGGRLVAVVGERPSSPAMVFTRHGGSLSSRHVFDASVPTLAGMTMPPPGFVF